ncbi:hypothetical protein P3T36_005813 [Kitasatospora sp. MAP12-15]|uniref:hypothetical protein n=1 Tax=unclassified Kitasatospora TaxID=2633591 RepID=UPI0024741196|nr:hypothetical protein [Kitasatospora sp. MAP12-44]MDH6110087.1 hypothetical protein [Kitasatospora sp. MAP12-44]
MAWTWRYEAADGSVVTRAEESEEFSGQGDAESWVGEEWKQLLEEGIERVALLDDGQQIYTMSLREG